MPTPLGDCVTISLLSALSGRKAGGDEVSELDVLLCSGSKQALSTDVEYELAENQFANSLSAMKAKYLFLSSKPSPKKNGLSLGSSNFMNGNGVKNGNTNGTANGTTNGTSNGTTNGTSNGTTNGVKNGNSINGVKVNPDSILPSPKIVLFPPEKVCLGWRGKHPVGAGMYNLGNTCYLNSILQALFHVPAFVNWLLNDSDHRKKCEAENGPSCGDCLSCALAKTLVTSRNNDIIKPELITSKLRMICRNLSVGAEEDAHEFMRYLLENVEKGYLKRVPQKKLDPYSRETTPINQIFGGYMRTEVTCRSCGNVSTTFQHFQDLLLDIRKVGKVDDALDQYFSKEILDGPNAYRCEKCTQVSQATKKFSIERPPKVLCVQLKRFTGSGNKIQKSIEVKVKLSLDKYLNPASSHHGSNIPLKYKLIAMVTHSGQSAGGGHYTAIAETASSSFYLFDDASVRPVNLTSVLNTSAYILFFEMEQAGSVNGQREKQGLGKGMPNKATPSTITSNGNGSSNGSSYPPLNIRKWEQVASPSQTSLPLQPQTQRLPQVQPQVQPQPRIIMLHNKKSKLSLDKSHDKLSALCRPATATPALATAAPALATAHAEAKSESRPGFIGPRLPTLTAADATSSPSPSPSPPQTQRADEPAGGSGSGSASGSGSGPKKRFLDGSFKGADEKTNGKQATSLVPYDEDSTSSESSLSPAPDASSSGSQSLTVKATTPSDWQVTLSPTVRNTTPVSCEGSTKTNWNVTPLSSPLNARKSNAACSSDSDLDSNTADKKLSRAARSDELPGVQKIPPTPADVLSNGVREKFFKKKSDGGAEVDRPSNDGREYWRDRTTDKEEGYHARNSHRHENGGDNHSRWSNGNGNGSGSWNGGGRGDSLNRSQPPSNGQGLSDRAQGQGQGQTQGMHSHNGVDSSNSWKKEPYDIVAHLNRMSHTGINDRIAKWNNERSNLERSVEEDRRLGRKRKISEYDQGIDRGRAKKTKMADPSEYPKHNYFNTYYYKFLHNKPEKNYHYGRPNYHYNYGKRSQNPYIYGRNVNRSFRKNY